MLWTAFVWGIGVSFGAASGTMLFVILYFALLKLVAPNFQTKTETYRQYIMEAMAHRNEIAMETNELLQEIAAAMCEPESEEDDPFSDESWRG